MTTAPWSYVGHFPKAEFRAALRALRLAGIRSQLEASRCAGLVQIYVRPRMAVAAARALDRAGLVAHAAKSPTLQPAPI